MRLLMFIDNANKLKVVLMLIFNFFSPCIGLPNITKEPMSLVVEEGGEAIFDCVAEGLPQPKVYWVFNGHNVVDDGNVQITG